MDDDSQLLKAMNVLMLKILENADWTSAFIVLIYLLQPVGSSRFARLAKHGAINVRNQKFLDLVVICLIKLTKDNQYRLLQALVKKGWDTLGQLLESPNSVRQKLANPNVLPWESHGSYSAPAIKTSLSH
jgi:hypothetical protein